MTDEDVTVVQRPGAAQGLHLPPILPGQPEPREKVDVKLVGGPHHGLVVSVWRDLKNVTVPVTSGKGDGGPLQPPPVTSRVDPRTGTVIVEANRQVVEATPSVVAVYTRRNRNAKMARFTDYKEED